MFKNSKKKKKKNVTQNFNHEQSTKRNKGNLIKMFFRTAKRRMLSPYYVNIIKNKTVIRWSEETDVGWCLIIQIEWQQLLVVTNEKIEYSGQTVQIEVFDFKKAIGGANLFRNKKQKRIITWKIWDTHHKTFWFAVSFSLFLSLSQQP